MRQYDSLCMFSIAHMGARHRIHMDLPKSRGSINFIFARIILPNDSSTGIHVLMQQHKNTAALRLP
jgi:hypothetical protein